VCSAATRRGRGLSSWRPHPSHRLTGGASSGRRLRRLLFQHRPVEGVVVLVVKGSEEDPEELPQVHVVWSFLEPEAPAIVEIHGELCGEALAKHLHRGRHLLLTNLLVLLFLRGGL